MTTRVNPPEPMLGRIRRIVLLPPGIGRALAFDGEGVELGNGWFDITARLATATAEWLPPLAWSFDLGRMATFPAPRPNVPRRMVYPDRMLCDNGRDPFRPLRTGTVVGDVLSFDDDIPAYWLYAGASWWSVGALELAPPSAENSGPAGSIAEQVAIDRTAA